ncbi:MAG: rhamnulose-1-phosphate aldolase [Candidatus Kapabacteria bacterium]|nr:rhamnulose-1-phosphate aldolase [Candidatus Kapabacteria bacterium]
MFDKIINQIKEIAELSWQKGWAERNAGNFSIRITSLYSSDNFYSSNELHKIKLNNFDSSGIEGEIFLVSCAGSRMRDISKSPQDHFCYVFIKNGNVYYTSISNSDKNKPSSELISHLETQKALINSDSINHAVLHLHATELITLTHFPDLCSAENLNKIILSMHTESLYFLPKGIGFIPFEIPGTNEIARLTAELITKNDLILWEKHGCIVSATDIREAFDMIDIASKSAAIYLELKKCRILPLGLCNDQIERLKLHYGIIKADNTIIFQD